ncbi:hypothetical protein CONCODRAFT_12733 [Conidiobolus coronatus NRRL 28638]|uniref:Cytochrome P450 n=1 Tax=Conidiobolus coronatus (strain ATCC 28846 / CBS 209.66 / NRRL 28638) TaxID=796925 RepID=A0A137NS99_CONC2|nr:hypothetical protein CONCODRAFT_12733 [Conidiobolus coronatus NRRL 28638]|eukprot:KXN65617.1 hypothetical protein CONCODRAFT_12733 [Conidiobolus coronatus NRRL 28638]
MLGFLIEGVTLPRVLLAIIIGYLGYLYYKNFHYPRHVGPLKTIPGPSNELLLTIKFIYARATGVPEKFYKDLHTKYGPICHSGLGLVAISDPEAAKLIYSSYKFEKEYRFEYCIENVQNIFSTCDKKYHSIRKRMISLAFNWKSVIQLESHAAIHCVDNTIFAINEVLDNGNTQVDVYDLFHRSIGDVISDLVIGRCFNSLKKPNFPATKLSVCAPAFRLSEV